MDYFKNYYEILNISPNATLKEIKKAYHNLALDCHPDRVIEEQKLEAEAKFKEVVEAYYVLSDPEKRKIIDQHFNVNKDSFEKKKHYYSSFDYSKQTASDSEYYDDFLKSIFGEYYNFRDFEAYSAEQWKNYKNPKKDSFDFRFGYWGTIAGHSLFVINLIIGILKALKAETSIEIFYKSNIFLVITAYIILLFGDFDNSIEWFDSAMMIVCWFILLLPLGQILIKFVL